MNTRLDGWANFGPVVTLGIGRLIASISARWGNKWGNMPHRSQPIPADLDFAKPPETMPHVVQRDCRFGLIIGPSLWEPEGRFEPDQV
jgi:hypothetical protein